MTLDNLVGRGLEREPTHRDEVLRFREKIRTKLADARNEEISADSRFDLAYQALLQIGLAALRVNGLRPDSRGGHHVLALQTLSLTIGLPREKLRLLDEFRRQRAAGLYDGTFSPSATELQALIATVEELHADFESWLASSHPEIL